MPAGGPPPRCWTGTSPPARCLPSATSWHLEPSAPPRSAAWPCPASSRWSALTTPRPRARPAPRSPPSTSPTATRARSPPSCCCNRPSGRHATRPTDAHPRSNSPMLGGPVTKGHGHAHSLCSRHFPLPLHATAATASPRRTGQHSPFWCHEHLCRDRPRRPRYRRSEKIVALTTIPRPMPARTCAGV